MRLESDVYMVLTVSLPDVEVPVVGVANDGDIECVMHTRTVKNVIFRYAQDQWRELSVHLNSDGIQGFGDDVPPDEGPVGVLDKEVDAIFVHTVWRYSNSELTLMVL